MASLSGFTPASTFASLIKTIDNLPLDANPRQLSDGVGNPLPISASTAAINLYSATMTGSLQGNASTSTSASYATTSSYSNTSTSASYALSASFSQTASYWLGSSNYTPTAYLSAFHTASLFAFVENTPLTMSFSTTDFSFGGVTISGSYSDKIKIANGGVYNIQFSAQTAKTSGTSTTFYIWLAKNGVEVPSSNTGVTLAGGSNDVAIPAWNFFTSASAGDYYQLQFAVTHNNGVIEYSPSGSAGLTGPAVPSVILTVNRVG